MDESRAKLITRLLRSGLAALLLLAIVNDSMRYVLAWSQVYLTVRDMNAALAPIVHAQPEDRAPAASAAAGAAAPFGVTIETYGQEVEESISARTAHIEVAMSNPVEHTVFAAPVQASAWKWPVRYWWHADAAPEVLYTWDTHVVLDTRQE